MSMLLTAPDTDTDGDSGSDNALNLLGQSSFIIR